MSWLISQYFILPKKYLFGEKVTLSYDSGWQFYSLGPFFSLELPVIPR